MHKESWSIWIVNSNRNSQTHLRLQDLQNTKLWATLGGKLVLGTWANKHIWVYGMTRPSWAMKNPVKFFNECCNIIELWYNFLEPGPLQAASPCCASFGLTRLTTDFALDKLCPLRPHADYLHRPWSGKPSTNRKFSTWIRFQRCWFKSIMDAQAATEKQIALHQRLWNSIQQDHTGITQFPGDFCCLLQFYKGPQDHHACAPGLKLPLQMRNKPLRATLC